MGADQNLFIQRPLVGNSSDKGQIDAANEAVEFEQEKRINDLRMVLKNPYVRRVLWRILGDCGLYSTSFTTKGSSETFFNEGKRSIGLKILSDMFASDMSAYVDMLTEARDAALAERQRMEDLIKQQQGENQDE